MSEVACRRKSDAWAEAAKIDSMDFAIVKICDNIAEAGLDKSRLEAEGIKAFVDAGIACINPMLNTAVGGIKLLVKEEDLERAKNILEA